MRGGAGGSERGSGEGWQSGSVVSDAESESRVRSVLVQRADDARRQLHQRAPL